eukprot:2157629-Karenia_brevis.AAC.1
MAVVAVVVAAQNCIGITLMQSQREQICACVFWPSLPSSLSLLSAYLFKGGDILGGDGNGWAYWPSGLGAH